MKKFFFNLLIFITLTGCVESISLIGPTSSVLVSGNVAQPTLSAAINHGVKAGRQAFLAGRIEKLRLASPSSPTKDISVT